MVDLWYRRIAGRLTRTTSTGRYVREIDGLRFIAIFTVVYQHLQRTLVARAPGLRPDLLGDAVESWRGGVELFFVVSGFVLALPFAAHRFAGGERVSIRQYFTRRLTRLEPPYLLMLVGFYVAGILYYHRPAAAMLANLLWSGVYMHVLHFGRGSDLNGVTWTLEVEVQFYVLAPLLATAAFAVRDRWVRRSALVVVILGFGEAFGYVSARHHLPFTVLDELGQFLAGFLVADVFLVDWGRDPPSSPRWDWVAVPGWLVVLPAYFLFPTIPHTGVRVPRVVLPLVFAGLIFAALRSRYFRGFLRLRPVAITGGMCYTIYLLHFPPMRVLARHLPVPAIAGGVTANTLLYLLPFTAFLATFCVPYFVLVERPCMRKDWPGRLWGRLTGRPVPAPADRPHPGSVEAAVHVAPSETDPLAANQPVP